MPNELRKGKRRVGDFIDFDPDTPEVKVALERSSRGISLELSWADSSSTYAQWFLKGSGIIQIPAPAAHAPVPERVLFVDSHGYVLLLGCRAFGFHSNLLGPGSGKLWAELAVLGVRENLPFENPHGLQTRISGLREWLGVNSWRPDVSESGGTRTATLTSLSSRAIEIKLGSGTTVALRPGWRLTPDRTKDRYIAHDLLTCETRTISATSWREHLRIHRGLRDLLVVSRWNRETLSLVGILREDDPLRTMDGRTHGEQWREVVTPNRKEPRPPAGFRPHLIEYGDLSENGIAGWLALRDEFARALDPVISSIELKSASPATLLAHTGPGLEALGYLLMVRDGVTESEAARANLRARFARILAQVGPCLPFDGEAWAGNTILAYNGLKHANRAAPEEVDLINAWRESVLVVRAWVALELGVDSVLLTERLRQDPQRHPYTLV